MLLRGIEGVQLTIAEETHLLGELQMKLESVLELMRMEGAQPIEGGRAGRHFVEEAYDLLLESGPLHYTRVADLLRERRVFVPGIRPEMNLLAHINRDRRFQRVGRGTYRAHVDKGGEEQRPARKSRGRRAA